MTDEDPYAEYIIDGDVKNVKDEEVATEEAVEVVYENIQEKQPRTKREQIERMAVFHRHYNEQLIGRDKFNDLWINLTAELNDIGPPVRSNTEWKRVWQVHKYGVNKRKRLCVPESTSRQDEIAPSDSFLVDSNSVMHQLLEKVCLVIEKQDSILKILEKSKDLLEVIANKQ